MIVDLFAGGGGASLGIEMATGRHVDVAVNHDHHAIQMHLANHPFTHHAEASVWEVEPKVVCAGNPVELLWLSPDCRHFSRAKGGAIVSPKVRTLARVAIPWAKQVRPRLICLENVREFMTWGPLKDGKPDPERVGAHFWKFVKDLRNVGYSVDWKMLNAADFGTPTSRTRLFLVARTDGMVKWPVPTHGPGRIPYRTAEECIDWSIPVPSIFGRSKPLADATQRRIAKGLVKFVLENKAEEDGCQQSFITKFYRTGKGQSLASPLDTVTAAGGKFALVTAWIAKHYGGVTGHGLGRPLGTVTTCDHHSLCTATHGDETPDHVVSWIMSYYGTAGAGIGIDEPLPTITTKDRMALVIARLKELRVVDIGMRMLTPRELARAQGFPDSYILTGTKTQQIHRIGNSVCPLIAKAVVLSNLAR